MDREICKPLKISWTFFRMDGTFKFLVWAVMVSLILAIARQLSEQTCLPLFPIKLGFLDYMDGQELGKGLELSNLTAQTSYEKESAKRDLRVGNYEQKTNNYKDDSPDSCSTPLTELVGL
jgi:hypothetical protein